MNTPLQDLRIAYAACENRPVHSCRGPHARARIGANTAIFATVNAQLLKMLPVERPQQLGGIGHPRNANSGPNGTPRTDIFPSLVVS